jgi:hypothetical protein
MPSLSTVKPVAGGIALVLAIAAPWLLSPYDLNLLARFLALSLTAMGLVLLWGEGGVSVAMRSPCISSWRGWARARCPISCNGRG